jgi:hypothetical protein
MKTLIAIFVSLIIWIVGYNVGKADGIQINEDRYQEKIDAICDAWPWPKPWPCAKGLPHERK